MTSTIHQYAASSNQSQTSAEQDQQQPSKSTQSNNMVINSSLGYLDHSNKVPILAPPRVRHVHSSLSPAPLNFDGANSSKGGPQRGHQRRQSVARLLPDISKLRLLNWLVEASSEMINCDIAIMDGVYAKLNHSQESLLFLSPQPASSLLASAQSIGSNSSSASLRTLLAHEHECGLDLSAFSSENNNRYRKMENSSSNSIQPVANFEHLSLGVSTNENNRDKSNEEIDSENSNHVPDEINKDCLVVTSKKPKVVKLNKKQLKLERKLQQQKRHRDKLSLPIDDSSPPPRSASSASSTPTASSTSIIDIVNMQTNQDLEARLQTSSSTSNSMTCHKSISSSIILTSPAPSKLSAESSSSASSTSSFVSGASDSASSSPPTMYDSPLGELQLVSEYSMDSSVSSSSHSPSSPNCRAQSVRDEDISASASDSTRSNIDGVVVRSSLHVDKSRKSASLLRNQRLFSVAAAANQQARGLNTQTDLQQFKSASFDATTTNEYESYAQSLGHDPAEDQGFEEDFCCDDDSYSSQQDSLMSDGVGSSSGANSQAWSLHTRHRDSHLSATGSDRSTAVDQTYTSNSISGSLRDLSSLHNQNRHYQSSSSLSHSNISHSASQHSAPSALLSSLAQNKSCQCYEGRSTPSTTKKFNNNNSPDNNSLTTKSQTNPINAATLSDIIRQIVMNHTKLSRLLQSIISRYDTEKMILMSSSELGNNNWSDSQANSHSSGCRIDISAILAALDECSCKCHHNRMQPILINNQPQQQSDNIDNSSSSVSTSGEQQGMTNSDSNHEQQAATCCDTSSTSNNNNGNKAIKRPKRFKSKAKKNDTPLDEESFASKWCENCSENHFESWFESLAADNAANGISVKSSNKNHQHRHLSVSQKNANIIKLLQQEVRSTLLKSIELIDLIRKQIKSPESIQQRHLLRCFANSIHLLTSVGCYVMPAQDVYNHFNQFINTNNHSGSKHSGCPSNLACGNGHNHSSMHHHQSTGGYVASSGLCRLPSSDFDHNLVMNASGQTTCDVGGGSGTAHTDQWPHLGRDRQHSNSMRINSAVNSGHNIGTAKSIQSSTRYAHIYNPSSHSTPLSHNIHNYYHHHHRQPLQTSLYNNITLSSSSSSGFSSSYSPLSSPPMLHSGISGGPASYVPGTNQAPMAFQYYRASLNHSSSSCSPSPSSSPSSISSPMPLGTSYNIQTNPYYYQHHYSSAVSSSSQSSPSYCYPHPYHISSSCKSSATFAGNPTYYGPNSTMPTHSATIGEALGVSSLADGAFLGTGGNGSIADSNNNHNSGLKFWQSPKFNFIRKIWHVRQKRLMRQQSKDRKLYNNKIQNKLKLVIGDYVHFHKSQTLLNTENGINSLCTSMKNALEFGLYLSQKLY